VGAFVLIRVVAVQLNWQTRSVADGPVLGEIEDRTTEGRDR